MFSIKDIDKQINRINRYISKGTMSSDAALGKLRALRTARNDITQDGRLSTATKMLLVDFGIRLKIEDETASPKSKSDRSTLKAENTDALGRHIKRRVATDAEGNQCFSASECNAYCPTNIKKLKAVCDVNNIRSDLITNKAYRRWNKMIAVCCDIHRDAYICEDWLKFSNFLKWYRKHNLKADKKIVAERHNGNLIYSPAHVSLKKVN